MENKARVLVTLLTWNRHDILKETINSLFENNGNLDILALDNGSTDSTCDLLESMNIETIKSPSNIGIFNGTSKLWLEADKRGYDFVINLQDDFPCFRKIPINDMAKYLNENQDVGFILLNNKNKLFKVGRKGKISVTKKSRKFNKFTKKKLKYKEWTKCGSTNFIKFNHHFTFNPTFIRTNILQSIVLNNPKQREFGIMERYHNLSLLSAKTKKHYFRTVIRKRFNGWIH